MWLSFCCKDVSSFYLRMDKLTRQRYEKIIFCPILSCNFKTVCKILYIEIGIVWGKPLFTFFYFLLRVKRLTFDQKFRTMKKLLFLIVFVFPVCTGKCRCGLFSSCRLVNGFIGSICNRKWKYGNHALYLIIDRWNLLVSFRSGRPFVSGRDDGNAKRKCFCVGFFL